jgi:segregation and condensation protein B
MTDLADAPASEAPVLVPDLESLPELVAAAEAVLLVADVPVPTEILAGALDVDVRTARAVLECLASGLRNAGRGIEVRETGGGWRMTTRPDLDGVVERFVVGGQQARLTQAALETRAVIAYRQPVSRGRVSAVRGVNVDGVVRTLLARGLVEEAGADPDSGATTYRTTAYFLDRLGIRSLDELPPLAPLLPDPGEIDDQPA